MVADSQIKFESACKSYNELVRLEVPLRTLGRCASAGTVQSPRNKEPAKMCCGHCKSMQWRKPVLAGMPNAMK